MAERMKIQIADDKTVVRIELLPESGAAGVLELTQEQLLKLIQGLGKAHQKLSESKDIPALEGTQIDAVFDTRWYVEPGLIGEAVMMSFQHPSYGAVGFAIPMDQAEYMVQLVTAQIDEAKSLKSTRQ